MRDDLRDEERGIVRRLLDFAFGRAEPDDNEEDHRLVRRLGTLRRRQQNDDD
jgi:hypothetical protein